MNTKNTAISLILVVILALGGWWLSARNVSASSSQALEASGTIEARTVNIATEIGGKIVEVLVEEGESVTADQPLARLDDSLLQNQRTQAETTLQTAQANLLVAQAAFYQATAGARPEDISAAKARLDQARAGYYDLTATLTSDQLERVRSVVTVADGNFKEAQSRYDDLVADSHNPDFAVAAAKVAVADAQATLASAQNAVALANDPAQPYYLQVEAARLTWELAQANLDQAKARRNGLRDEDRVTEAARKAAESTVEEAQDMVNAAKDAYDTLTSGLAAERLDTAWDEIQRAQNQLAGYGRNIPAVETLLAQIEVARAQVASSQAQLATIDTQLDKLTITATSDGVVLTRSIEPGSMAMPGSTLLEIGHLDRLELRVYLPEEKFGQVMLGQAVRVTVDAYPGQIFTGTVMRLANEAEFTPTNVQTKEDRTRLVYAVTIGLDNSDLTLKPGMISDVMFGP